MEILKRKQEPNRTLIIRVPASVKARLEALRKAADEAGYDVSATVSEAIIKLTDQIEQALHGGRPKPVRERKASGLNGEPARYADGKAAVG
jgi:hypothetical protein